MRIRAPFFCVKRFLAPLLLLSLILAGCGFSASASNAKPELTDSAVLSATETPLPTETPTPVPIWSQAPSTPEVCTEQDGHIVKSEISAPTLPNPLRYWVYLPACYTAHGPGYPVLYIIHGQLQSPYDLVKMGMVSRANEMITKGEIPPFIIVFPIDENWSDEPMWSGFGSALIDVLLPHIDEEYHTCISRDCRFISGFSRGGGWTIYLGITHWDKFSAAYGHSAAPFMGQIPDVVAALDSGGAQNFPRFKLDYGAGDPWTPYGKDVIDFLTNEYNLPAEWEVEPGAYHDWTYWSRQMDNYYRWFFGIPEQPIPTGIPWDTPKPTWTFLPAWGYENTPIPTNTPGLP